MPRQRVPVIPREVAMLGMCSFFAAMSSAMVYGLLPVFLVRVLGVTMASVGLIEGAAEGLMSLARIGSGVLSDWLGRRKPLIVVGYVVSALNKAVFPLATAATIVFAARVVDRFGKGLRDAPRDAFVTDVTPGRIRGAGFGLRLTFYTSGYVVGPLVAIALMQASDDDFRLVFWIAVIPAAAAALVMLLAVKERPWRRRGGRRGMQAADLELFPVAFWWAVGIASLLSLARFTPAFLVMKGHSVGIDPAFLPAILMTMHLVYAIASYPFGLLADRIERRWQLVLGASVLIASDIVLAMSASPAMVALGAAIWGLQFAITQGLLAAAVADKAPVKLRGTAFGILDVTNGLATFAASSAAGLFWALASSDWAFAFSAAVGGLAIVALCWQPVIYNHRRTRK